MRKQPSHTFQYARRRASLGLHYLLDELRLLMSGFPDPNDAFDPDELPLAFILRRDSRRAQRRGKQHTHNGKVTSRKQEHDNVS